MTVSPDRGRGRCRCRCRRGSPGHDRCCSRCRARLGARRHRRRRRVIRLVVGLVRFVVGVVRIVVTRRVLAAVAPGRSLITARRTHSPAVEALWREVQKRVELTTGGPDEVLARLADVLTRRLIAVLEVFDDRIEQLIELALNADGELIREVTTVRRDLAVVRREIQPQREALDLLQVSTSQLVTRGGRRRYADVFDVASRVSSRIDAARTALTETLEAYRGAEAKQATEVSKVLTVYAAIMLPLSLIVGFFGMNFQNLPGTANDNGWWIVTVAMVVLATISLGMFVSLGWIRRPSGRQAGALVGRGLIEGARAPIELVNAAFEISTSPMRSSSKTEDEADASQSGAADAD